MDASRCDKRFGPNEKGLGNDHTVGQQRPRHSAELFAGFHGTKHVQQKSVRECRFNIVIECSEQLWLGSHNRIAKNPIQLAHTKHRLPSISYQISRIHYIADLSSTFIRFTSQIDARGSNRLLDSQAAKTADSPRNPYHGRNARKNSGEKTSKQSRQSSGVF